MSQLMTDLLKWTWAAFTLTAITGALMFSTNAIVYFHNTFFRIKMLLLVLAAVNMLVFELTARKTLAQWDRSPDTPPLAKVVATVSLVIWVGVIAAGRVIGFTATRTSVTEPTATEQPNFEDLLGLPK